MNKTHYLIPLAAIPFTLTGCCHNNKEARPNVIFILSDDHTWQSIGAYGSLYESVDPTPNIDRLAEEGALFRNAFCTNSISGPSRASIITGKYSHANGFFKNVGAAPFDSTQITFPMMLHDHGYTTSLFGKWHLESTPQGFDHYKIHVGQGQYWDPVWIEDGERYKDKGYATTLTADSALEWLESRDKEKPFCMLLHFKAPHRPWNPEPKYEHIYDNVTMPYPETFDDDYGTREQTAGNTEMTIEHHLTPGDLKVSAPEGLNAMEAKKWSTLGQKGEFWTPSDTLSGHALKQWKYQRYVKDYLATAKSVDDQVGRLMQYLKDNGLDENTIVIYCGDQGFYLGEHGWFDKRFMYEESMRMPFIVRWPEKIRGNTEIRDLISNVDFAPTILGMCGVAPDKGMQGEDYSDLFSGKKKDHKQSIYYHYYEYPFWHHVQPHYGIRTERYKLIHFYYDIDVWEMYDLEKDPNELHNIYGNPEYAAVRDSLMQDLEARQVLYGDTGSLDEFRAMTDLKESDNK